MPTGDGLDSRIQEEVGDNVHSFAQISAFIPKNSLNLLSLVLIAILAERVATNVAANVQKTAGSMGIGMVHEEEIVVMRSFFRSRGTVLRRSYVVREKRSEKRSQRDRFSKTIATSKTLKTTIRKASDRRPVFNSKSVY